MNLKKLILCSLLLAIGLVLHQLVPPILFGMKPDFLLSMMFVAIALCDDYKLALLIGLAAGILTAATTGFPGGQIPNIIDKLITSNIVYLLFKLGKNTFNHQIKIFIVSLLGTLISGFIFLTSASIIVGLPVSFLALVIGAVLPAALFNVITSMILYNASYLAANNMR